ncbi:MAG TPA: hypothetical protein VLA09_05650, partial [Longimicrobiales bacterium]|nr:hypothetical protein [Longimicrobiales bacterium]
PRESWATGDYLVGEVLFAPRESSRIESTLGRDVEVVPGDLVIGALGRRAATLSAVGDWESIGPDGVMESLTAAGLMGKATSVAWHTPPIMRLRYEGHVVRDDRKVVMRDFVAARSGPPFAGPVVLIIGTSMEAGKTSTAKMIIRQLKATGRKVVGAKLTGAGRYRDILAMRDAGADAVYDFVDAGLPSSVCSKPEYRDALSTILSLIGSATPDVVVAEAGASPLEPYNGETLIEEIGGQVRWTVLCASDPYSVVGVVQGFGIVPDLVAGIATNTTAGIDLVHRLTGLEALNVHDRSNHPRLRELLETALGGAGS